jgi:hypothetical protein
LTRITVCRDCCCGSGKKHPGDDHDYLLDVITHGTQGLATTRVSDCLDACERSDVVVVSAAAGVRGVKPVWLSGILTEALADDVVSWVAAGGPGRAELPAALRGRAFRPPAQSGKR